MSEEAGNAGGQSANPPSDSIKSSVVLEEEKQGSSTDVGGVSKEPTIIIPPGFRGLFSLKSKNMGAKERFN